MNKKNKKCSFPVEKNLISVFETYSKYDYDRSQIDSVLYRKCYKKVSNMEWNHIMDKLNEYKKKDMVLHIDYNQ